MASPVARISVVNPAPSPIFRLVRQVFKDINRRVDSCPPYARRNGQITLLGHRGRGRRVGVGVSASSYCAVSVPWRRRSAAEITGCCDLLVIGACVDQPDVTLVGCCDGWGNCRGATDVAQNSAPQLLTDPRVAAFFERKRAGVGGIGRDGSGRPTDLPRRRGTRRESTPRR